MPSTEASSCSAGAFPSSHCATALYDRRDWFRTAARYTSLSTIWPSPSTSYCTTSASLSTWRLSDVRSVDRRSGSM